MWIKVMPVKAPDLYSNIPNGPLVMARMFRSWPLATESEALIRNRRCIFCRYQQWTYRMIADWKVPCNKTALFKNLQYNKFSSFHFHLAVNLYEMIIKWNEHKPRKIIPSQQYVFEKSLSLKYYTLLLSRNL